MKKANQDDSSHEIGWTDHLIDSSNLTTPSKEKMKSLVQNTQSHTSEKYMPSQAYMKILNNKKLSTRDACEKIVQQLYGELNSKKSALDLILHIIMFQQIHETFQLNSVINCLKNDFCQPVEKDSLLFHWCVQTKNATYNQLEDDGLNERIRRKNLKTSLHAFQFLQRNAKLFNEYFNQAQSLASGGASILQEDSQQFKKVSRNYSLLANAFILSGIKQYEILGQQYKEKIYEHLKILVGFSCINATPWCQVNGIETQITEKGLKIVNYPNNVEQLKQLYQQNGRGISFIYFNTEGIDKDGASFLGFENLENFLKTYPILVIPFLKERSKNGPDSIRNQTEDFEENLKFTHIIPSRFEHIWNQKHFDSWDQQDGVFQISDKETSSSQGYLQNFWQANNKKISNLQGINQMILSTFNWKLEDGKTLKTVQQTSQVCVAVTKCKFDRNTAIHSIEIVSFYPVTNTGNRKLKNLFDEESKDSS